MYMHTCMYVSVYCHGVCGGQMMTFRKQFSSLPMWVLGTEVRFPGLVVRSFTSWAISLPHFLEAFQMVWNYTFSYFVIVHAYMCLYVCGWVHMCGPSAEVRGQRGRNRFSPTMWATRIRFPGRHFYSRSHFVSPSEICFLTRVRVQVCVNMCVSVRVYAYMCVYVYMPVCVCMPVYVYICMCVYLCIVHVYVCIIRKKSFLVSHLEL